MMRLWSAGVVVALAAVAVVCGRVEPPPAEHAAGRDLLLVSDTESFEGRVPSRTTLERLLREHQMRADLVPVVVSVVAEVFDPRRLRAGQPFRLVRTLDGELRRFEYEIDADRMLRVLPPEERAALSLKADVVQIAKEHAVATVEGEISRDTPSLVGAIEAAGEGIDLALAVAEVFAGDIDFNVDLQPGDRFAAVVDKMTRDGAFAGYGPVLGAEFTNAGRRLRAVRFTPSDGSPGYYDEHGRSLRRFLLASPLKFTARVSSGYSRSRFHPILRICRPHLGVDYVAAAGSPVVAVAGGVVTRAGTAGEAGRMVQLRHPNGYETVYMHLSSIAQGVRVGARVEQGQLIGRVGSSGLATGPHLDYRIRRNGVYVNPLVEHKRMPPGEPIAAGQMSAFEAERDRLLGLLSGGASGSGRQVP
jgi:murein DD-endopeptidase MepM/ murein hydrolase activator NlpD